MTHSELYHTARRLALRDLHAKRKRGPFPMRSRHDARVRALLSGPITLPAMLARSVYHRTYRHWEARA